MATLLIDFGSRESEMCEELADMLQAQGIVSYVDDQDGYYDTSGCNFYNRSKLDTHFIVTPSFSSRRTWYVRLRSLLKQIPLVLFHTEQIVNPEFINEKLDFIGGPKYLTDVDYHLVWGKEFATLLLGRGVPREKIYIVGSPRLYNGDSTPDLRLPDKVVILTSFDPADWSDDRWLEECENYQYNPDLKLHNKFNLMRSLFCESLMKTIKGSVDEQFVIRTHPGESIAFYENFFEGMHNVAVENGDHRPLLDLLNRASFVITPMHSTVIYDLVALGVEFICIDCIDTEATYPKAAYAGIKCKDVTSLDDLKTQAYISVDAARSQFQRFFDVQQLPSIDRVAAALVSISQEKNPKKRWDIFDFLHLIELFLKSAYVAISKFLPKVLRHQMQSKIKLSRQLWLDGGHGHYVKGPYHADPKRDYAPRNFEVTFCPETNCRLVRGRVDD